MEGGHIVEISDEDEIFQNPKDERTRQFLKKFM
jgi:polar amino acid transport system ATP-binding protein